MKKAVVLLSSGLDSTFNLYKARADYEIALALTFNYGQRAAVREIEHAARISRALNIPHKTLELPWFHDFTKTSLLGKMEVPSGGSISIDDLAVSQKTAKAVWVPNRNGILLNIAAGFAEGLDASVIIPGFNAEEAATFPDNSSDFMRSLDQSFSFSTANGVRVECYSVAMSKSEIVREGIKLGLPFGELWPCYLAGEAWCGQCESCQRYQRALKVNGVTL